MGGGSAKVRASNLIKKAEAEKTYGNGPSESSKCCMQTNHPVWGMYVAFGSILWWQLHILGKAKCAGSLRSSGRGAILTGEGIHLHEVWVITVVVPLT